MAAWRRIPGRRVDISFGVLLPAVCAGVAVISLLLLAQWGPGGHECRPEVLHSLALGVGLATFASAYLLVRWLLTPVQRFVTGAEQYVPRPPAPVPATRAEKSADLARIDEVFNEVTTVLESLDVKALFPEIIGQSRGLRGVLGQVARVAKSQVAVLLTGESGTGKELVARAIHRHSSRQTQPFIAVNCAAIPDGLLESDLFGHEKGAFTGATSQRKGRFELADKGTLLLDEIGDMPLETQAKILRAIELGVCERVGGSQPIRFDTRIIAATNKNLPEMVREGSFREDLFHRLNVFPIHIPPLRERQEDIPVLAAHFLEQLGRNTTLPPGSLQRLVAHEWPGNVRELRNTVHRASVLADGGPIQPGHLVGLPPLRLGAPAALDLGQVVDLDAQLAEMEKAMIIAALAKSRGLQVRAASLLGIKERSLWHRIKKYEIDVAAFKDQE